MKKPTIFLFSFITLTGISVTWDVSFRSSFSSSFDVWSKDVYSKILNSFEILRLIAFKLGWLLYFKIADSTWSKRPFVLSLGKFLLLIVSKFLTILLY